MIASILRCNAVRSSCMRAVRPLAQRPTRPQSPNIRAFCVGYRLHDRVDIVVPSMAESISEGTLSAINKEVGEEIEADDEFASIETDKIDVSVNAPSTGRIVEIHAASGDTVTVGQKLATIETDDQAAEAPKPKVEANEDAPAQNPKPAPTQQESSPQPPQPTTPPQSSTPPQPSPPEAAMSQGRQTSSSPPAPPKPETQHAAGTTSTLLPGNTLSRQDRVERMPRIRQTIARRLKESQNRTASLTTVQRLDMTNLMQWRKQNKEAVLEKHGVRLGYMGAFTKAATLAAQEIPLVNGAMDMEKEIIIYRDYVDVSIAVSTPKGLVTPVVRNTHIKDIIEIERAVGELAGKARDNKLTLDDLAGGNFSISNPGIFGSLFGTPLINYPQSAVFNMNSIRDEAVVVDGKIEIRPMMYITLTYDHRLIDGREAVGFLNIVKGYIENPASMLLASPRI